MSTEQKQAGRLTIAIMAGGASRRMGRDKCEIMVDGTSFLHRTAATALGTEMPVVIVGRDCPKDWELHDVRFVPDSYPGEGPLRGLATALETAGTDILLLACDMPLLRTDAVRWLVAQYQEIGETRQQRVSTDQRSDRSKRASARSQTEQNTGKLQMLLVKRSGRPEPLFSFYFHSILSEVIKACERGEFSFKALIASRGKQELITIDLPPQFNSDLHNVNRPDDLDVEGLRQHISR